MAPTVFRSHRRSLTAPVQTAAPNLTPRRGIPRPVAGGDATEVWWRRPPRRSVVLGAALAAATALLLGLILMGQMAVAAPATGTSAPTLVTTVLSGGETFAVLPWGQGEGQVGRSSPAEGLDRGPEALAATSDGRVVVLDSVNHRVVTLADDGTPLGAFTVPLSNPRYLAAGTERLAILDPDDSRRVVVTTWSGEVLEQAQVPTTNDPATGIFLDGERVWMETGHSRCLLLAGGNGRGTVGEERSGRPVGAGVMSAWAAVAVGSKDSAGDVITLEAVGDSRAASGSPARTEARLGMPLEHLVALEADQRGRVHVGARVAGGTHEPRLLVTRFTSRSLQGSPAPASLLLFAEASGPYLGPPFTIAPDGRVLQPVGEADGYRILVHRFPDEA